MKVDFVDLVAKSTDEQTEFFLKSFIFALGDDWKAVSTLASKFTSYLDDVNESHDIDTIQAADFLQKNGKTRTALQRKAELKDVDLDGDNRITFLELLLLCYKELIVTEYYKRTGEKNEFDMSNDCVGLTGVGDVLLQELFTFPAGMDPAVEEAIEEFMAQKRRKAEMVKDLEAKAALGGVKGLTAKAELNQLAAADSTEENRIEVTLNAAKRKASKTSSAVMLSAKKQKQEEEVARKRRDSRTALAARAALFEKN